MGVDPGTNFTGYGIIDVCGNEVRCVAMGYIDLAKLKNPYDKLKLIFERVSGFVKEFNPDEVALESPFFGENVQSMLKLGRAQGVAMAAALVEGKEVFEYAPRLVKQSITGRGGASKEQVASLLGKMLKVEYDIKRLDATDGLAVAMCHYFQSSATVSAPKNPKSRTSTKSWDSFLAQNPTRIIKSRK